MLNVFALVLVIFTLISGIFWFLKYFKISYYLRCTSLNKLYVSNQINRLEKLKIKFLFNMKCFINFVFDFCASIFPILFFVFIVRSFIFEPFQIPSGSMMPTLLIGDFILVNKFCYGIKNPINQKLFIHVNSPKRGDLVVFKYPHDTKLDYIKRVIGIPGDRIVYNSFTKKLTIYPDCIKSDHSICTPLPVVYRNICLSNFVQILNTTSNGEIVSNFYEISVGERFDNGIRLIQSEESFDSNIYHNILTITEPDFDSLLYKNIHKKHICKFISEWIVPEHKYFMLGDNRDNSSDSRYWGFVPEKNIVGKAVIIWMSIDKQDSKWPILIRFSRLGKIY